MPPAAVAAAGLGAGLLAGATKTGQNNFQPTDYQRTSDYDPNAFQYGGQPGGAAAAENTYGGIAASNQAKQAEYGAQQENLYNAGVSSLQNDATDRGTQGQVLGGFMQDANAPIDQTISGQVAKQQAGALAAGQESLANSARGPAALALAQQQRAANVASGTATIAGTEGINAAQEKLNALTAAGGLAGAMRQGDTGAAGTAFGAGAQSGNLGIASGNLGLGYNQLQNQVATTEMQGQMANQDLMAQQHTAGQTTGAEVSAANAGNSWKPWQIALGGMSGGGAASGMMQQGAASATSGGGGGGGGGTGTAAHGGHILGDDTYMVGEHGPEMVVPAKDGFVLTALQTAALRGAPPTPQQAHDLEKMGHARDLGGLMNIEAGAAGQSGVDPNAGSQAQISQWAQGAMQHPGMYDSGDNGMMSGNWTRAAGGIIAASRGRGELNSLYTAPEQNEFGGQAPRGPRDTRNPGDQFKAYLGMGGQPGEDIGSQMRRFVGLPDKQQPGLSQQALDSVPRGSLAGTDQGPTASDPRAKEAARRDGFEAGHAAAIQKATTAADAIGHTLGAPLMPGGMLGEAAGVVARAGMDRAATQAPPAQAQPVVVPRLIPRDAEVTRPPARGLVTTSAPQKVDAQGHLVTGMAEPPVSPVEDASYQGTSDPKAKTRVLGGPHDNEVSDMLDETPAVEYRYKDAKYEPEAQRPGERQIGFLTTDLKKTPLGAAVVEERPDGLEGYNRHRMTGLQFGAIHNLHERLRDIESRIPKGGK